jgi:nicotinic acid mononucleotide adenylyltransferase
MEIKDNISPTNTLFEYDDINNLPKHRLKIRQTNLIPAVCFYNGSFVPIHGGHINVLEEAKRYINNLGTHELLGAYISPSHSGYIARKLNPEEVIGAGHRLSMIYLAIENLDWVMVDLFETFQARNTPLFIIMETFITRVQSQLVDGKQLDVFWLRGEDALDYISLFDGIIGLGFHPTYVINRGDNKNIINEKSFEDYYEKKWQYIRSLSSYPER